MHLVDTLSPGGAERMCVQLANSLPRERFSAHVCATRRTGPLASEIAPHVRFLDLRRRGRFDLGAIVRLRRYVKQNAIRILHAHGTAVFLAAAVKAMGAQVAVVWHDHCGERASNTQVPLPYRVVKGAIASMIVVNQKLRTWAIERLGMPAERVWLIPNFVIRRSMALSEPLPGAAGFRIAQVANIRPQKDHATMIRAMARIAAAEPRAHLLLIGEAGGDSGASIRSLIRESGLERHVSLLGLRSDVPAILKECAVGVLSSASEGLPLALLEYGEAGVAAVCTAVGDCPSLLRTAPSGCLTAPGDDRAMAEAVLGLLRDSGLRTGAADALRAAVQSEYSEESALEAMVHVYEQTLA